MRAKRKRKIDPKLRASVYILLAALNNIIGALKAVPDERNPDLERLYKELMFKMQIFYTNEALHEDFQRDVKKVLSGLTGYETTNATMLGLSILIHYLELKDKKITLSKEFVDTVYQLDTEVFDRELRNQPESVKKLVDKSIEAGDKVVQGIIKYVGDNYA